VDATAARAQFELKIVGLPVSGPDKHRAKKVGRSDGSRRFLPRNEIVVTLILPCGQRSRQRLSFKGSLATPLVEGSPAGRTLKGAERPLKQACRRTWATFMPRCRDSWSCVGWPRQGTPEEIGSKKVFNHRRRIVSQAEVARERACRRRADPGDRKKLQGLRSAGPHRVWVRILGPGKLPSRA